MDSMWNLAAAAANTVATIAADPVGASTQIVANVGNAAANAVGTAVKGVVQFDPAPEPKAEAPSVATNPGPPAVEPPMFATVAVAVGGSQVAQPPDRKGKLANENLARADAWRNTTDEHKAFAKAHWKRARGVAKKTGEENFGN